MNEASHFSYRRINHYNSISDFDSRAHVKGQASYLQHVIVISQWVCRIPIDNQRASAVKTLPFCYSITGQGLFESLLSNRRIVERKINFLLLFISLSSDFALEFHQLALETVKGLGSGRQM